jgi:2'-5' RNA ligase
VVRNARTKPQRLKRVAAFFVVAYVDREQDRWTGSSMDVSLQRCFVALVPERDTLDALDAWRAPLGARRTSGVHWVAREQIHLTIRFIGALTPHVFESLVRDWATLAPELGAAPTQRIGLLPSAKRPRVLAVELVASAALAALVERVDALLDRAGASYEKRQFRPHLTVARIRGDARIHHRDLETVRPAPPLARFHALELVSSTLTQHGPQYATLASAVVEG